MSPPPPPRQTQELNRLAVLVHSATRPGLDTDVAGPNELPPVPVVSLLPTGAPYRAVLSGLAASAIQVDAPRSRTTFAIKRLVDRERCGILLVTQDAVGREALDDATLREAVAILVVMPASAGREERARVRQHNRQRGAVATIYPDQVTPLLLETIIDATTSSYWNVRAGNSAADPGSRRGTGAKLELSRELVMGSIRRLLGQSQTAAPFALHVLRIDRYRVFADLLGTQGCGSLVDMVGKRIAGVLGAVDTIAYLGDGRFAILHEGEDAKGGLTQRLSGTFDAAFEVVGETLHVAPRIGVVRRSARSYQAAQDVIRDAILASDEADVAGGAAEFKTSMRIEAADELRLEADLARAIDAGDLTIAYQPIVDLQTGSCDGFEALVRWIDPARGFVSPARFVPLAEKSQLIHELGAYVLDRATRQVATWNDELGLDPGLIVSVNVSAKQLIDDRLPVDLERVLASTGIDPARLKLEFTETAMIQNIGRVTQTLRRCRDLGVSVWVDDFGTGYSSLAHVQRFPIDGLKLDKSFVDPLDGSHGGSAMARAVLEIARILDVHVVAEGVEHEHQIAELVSLGCRFAQGYVFAKPLSVADAYAFLGRNAT